MKKLFILVCVLCFTTGAFSQGIRFTKDDTIKYIVKNETPRFFAGTFWSGIEFPSKAASHMMPRYSGHINKVRTDSLHLLGTIS